MDRRRSVERHPVEGPAPGSGDAVVASQVRVWAQRSADQATRITDVATHRRGDGNAASAEEQAVGLREVNSAVNQMDHVTQQIAALVEQATAARHSLREETDALAAMMDQFRTGDERISKEVGVGGNAAKARHWTSARSGRRPIADMAGGGRAATTHDASWEDF